MKKQKKMQSDSKAIEDLREEFHELGLRRDQLSTSLEEAQARHTEAQERMLSGDKTIASATVALHYSSVSSLREAIATLDTRVSDLQQKLREAEKKVAEERTRSRLKTLTRELAECEHDFISCRQRIDDFLQQHLNEQVIAFRHWQKLIVELDQLLINLGEAPTKRRIMTLPQGLAFGAAIDHLTAHQFKIATQPTRAQMRARNRQLSQMEEQRRQQQVVHVQKRGDNRFEYAHK